MRRCTALRHEFNILMRLPPHENVIKVKPKTFTQAALAHASPQRFMEEPASSLVAFFTMENGGNPVYTTMTGSDVELMLQHMLRALRHVHGHGVLHRDIKPGNILWDGSRYRLADFGLSCYTRSRRVERVVGSPLYLSRKCMRRLCMNEDCCMTALDDLESLTFVVLHYLCGTLPWDRANETKVMFDLKCVYIMNLCSRQQARLVPRNVLAWMQLVWQADNVRPSLYELNFE